MKNYFLVLLSVLLLFTLSSCGNSGQSDLERAKQELLGNVEPKQDNEEKDKVEVEKTSDTDDQDVDMSEEKRKSSVTMKDITEDPIISFDDFSVSDFEDLEHDITGKISGEVDKVTVLFSSSKGDISMQEPYTLKKFKAGDPTFLYHAFKKYGSIGYGLNTYLVTAYQGDKKHQIELQVYLQEPDLNLQQTVGKVDIDSLPQGAVYGTPVKIGDGKVTYSDIKGLEIKNIGNIDLSADGDVITKYLTNTTKGWFYWNTLRSIASEKGVSFYVVSRASEKGESVYEKHYYNQNGLYGILTLESGMKSEKPLQELNSELSERNANYAQVKVADALFADITK